MISINIKERILDNDESKKKIDIEPIRELQRKKELQNTVSDGFNLCTIQYMQRVAESLKLDYVPGGVCLRNA